MKRNKDKLKTKNEISLLEYYKRERKNYRGIETEKALEKLLSDFVSYSKEYLKPVKNTIAAVDSIDEVLQNINFNWIEDLNKYSKLKWFDGEGQIGNILDFYKINKKLFDLLIEKEDAGLEVIIEFWSYYVGEFLQNTGTFHNDALNITSNIIYIKNTDIDQWTKDQSMFDVKKFGDNSCSVSVNFIYKVSDDDFHSSNLEAKVLNAKKFGLFR